MSDSQQNDSARVLYDLVKQAMLDILHSSQFQSEVKKAIRNLLDEEGEELFSPILKSLVEESLYGQEIGDLSDLENAIKDRTNGTETLEAELNSKAQEIQVLATEIGDADLAQYMQEFIDSDSVEIDDVKKWLTSYEAKIDSDSNENVDDDANYRIFRHLQDLYNNCELVIIRSQEDEEDEDFEDDEEEDEDEDYQEDGSMTEDVEAIDDELKNEEAVDREQVEAIAIRIQRECLQIATEKLFDSLPTLKAAIDSLRQACANLDSSLSTPEYKEELDKIISIGFQAIDKIDARMASSPRWAMHRAKFENDLTALNAV